MEKWEGKVAVVTGASTGIGASIAKILAEKGLKVVGFARRVDRIEEVSRKFNGSGKLYAKRCDVSLEEDILRAFSWVKENLGPIHVLINNAGIMRNTKLIDGNAKEWRKTFDVCFMGYCICAREAIKIMRKNNIDGHIINMNSIFGHYIPNVANPTYNVYPAAKHAVTSICETLRHEIKQKKVKIKVTSISPGYVNTALGSIYKDDSFKQDTPYLNPEDVAEAVVYVLSTAPHVQVQELMLRPVGDVL